MEEIFKKFNPELFILDINNMQWSDVLEEQNVNTALNMFMDKWMKLVVKLEICMLPLGKGQ